MIHLKIFGPDEEVPKEGWSVKQGAYHWPDICQNGVGIFTITPDIIPFLEELMTLARKGNAAEMITQGKVAITCEEVSPDPLITAIREVGAGIVEAIRENAIAVTTEHLLVHEEALERITAISEKVRNK